MLSRHLSRVTLPISGIVSAKPDSSVPLAASPGTSGENVNYVVKSPDVSGLSFL